MPVFQTIVSAYSNSIRERVHQKPITFFFLRSFTKELGEMDLNDPFTGRRKKINCIYSLCGSVGSFVMFQSADDRQAFWYICTAIERLKEGQRSGGVMNSDKERRGAMRILGIEDRRQKTDQLDVNSIDGDIRGGVCVRRMGGSARKQWSWEQERERWKGDKDRRAHTHESVVL